MGYYRAGFTVVGVDIEPQPHYPFEFIRADAIEYLRRNDWADVVHASPPCQRYSTMTKRWGRETEHPDLIGEVRDLVRMSGVPYVIENVPGSPLRNFTTLCGSMFGLKVRRHRNFESNLPVTPLLCDHLNQGPIVGVYGNTGGRSNRDGITFGKVADWREAMGIEWMTAAELREAIPPAYTEYIGGEIMGLAGWR